MSLGVLGRLCKLQGASEAERKMKRCEFEHLVCFFWYVFLYVSCMFLRLKNVLAFYRRMWRNAISD